MKTGYVIAFFTIASFIAVLTLLSMGYLDIVYDSIGTLYIAIFLGLLIPLFRIFSYLDGGEDNNITIRMIFTSIAIIVQGSPSTTEHFVLRVPYIV